MLGLLVALRDRDTDLLGLVHFFLLSREKAKNKIRVRDLTLLEPMVLCKLLGVCVGRGFLDDDDFAFFVAELVDDRGHNDDCDDDTSCYSSLSANSFGLLDCLGPNAFDSVHGFPFKRGCWVYYKQCKYRELLLLQSVPLTSLGDFEWFQTFVVTQ